MFLNFKNKLVEMFAPKKISREEPPVLHKEKLLSTPDVDRGVINMKFYNSNVSFGQMDALKKEVLTTAKFGEVSTGKEVSKDAFTPFNTSVVSHVYKDAFYNLEKNMGLGSGDERHQNSLDAIKASIFFLDVKLYLVVMPSTQSYWVFYDPNFWVRCPDKMTRELKYDNGCDVTMGLLAKVTNVGDAIKTINSCMVNAERKSTQR